MPIISHNVHLQQVFAGIALDQGLRLPAADLMYALDRILDTLFRLNDHARRAALGRGRRLVHV